jgi:glycosyltransferase involved in cell wall biosynthesis
MNVLIITAAMPFPPMSGGQLRTFHIAKAIARQHAVKVVGFTYGERHEAPPYAAEVVAVPWAAPRLYSEMKSENPEQAKRASRLLDADLAEPWLASCYDVPAMEDAIGQQISQGVDLVLFEGTPLARFLPLVPAGIPRILDLMDLCSLMAQRAADCAQGEAHERAGREATRVRKFESWAAGECDALLVCSEQELESAKHLIGVHRAHLIANGVNTRHFVPKRGKPESGNILFTGNFGYAPNAEGAQYFVHQILPLITACVPHAALHLAGAQAGPTIRDLGGPRVRVHGRVDDMRPYQELASVVVAPLLRGGGTRLKILEAAASANAIVTTSIGVDGLEFSDGDSLLIRDPPRYFADAVIRILQEPALRAALGARAREVSEEYDWAAIESRVADVVNETQRALA